MCSPCATVAIELTMIFEMFPPDNAQNFCYRSTQEKSSERKERDS